MSTGRRILAACVVLGLALGVLALAALCCGSTLLTPAELWAVATGRAHSPVAAAVLLDLRLPRVAVAILAGGALSVGGLVFQAILRNPLAEPYILGVSGGAAIGGIGGLLAGSAGLSGGALLAGLMPASFAGGIATLLLVLWVGNRLRSGGANALLLAGVMVNAFCGAVILFLMTLVPHGSLGSVVYWLMGGLSYTEPVGVLALGLVLAPCLAGIMLLAHPMNLLQLGAGLARTTGVRVVLVRRVLLWLTTIMVSACVAVCGPLGFIGLVVPHALRRVLGADHRVLVPACALAGGGFLLFCDLLARTLPATGELPVGVMTALIGAPTFIVLLVRRSA